jgi:hypothetical protein
VLKVPLFGHVRTHKISSMRTCLSLKQQSRRRLQSRYTATTPKSYADQCKHIYTLTDQAYSLSNNNLLPWPITPPATEGRPEDDEPPTKVPDLNTQLRTEFEEHKKLTEATLTSLRGKVGKLEDAPANNSWTEDLDKRI